MARELKEIIVRDLKERFGGVCGCVLIDYQGLNAEATLDLRGALREEGVRMAVVQNRLMRRVVADREDLPEAFGDLLQGPTALLFGDDEASVLAASKSLSKWQKKNKDLASVKGGLFDGKVLSVEDVVELSQVPDHPTLQAQTAGMFLSPMQSFASAVQALLSHFAGCAKERHGQLGGDDAGAEDG